MAVDVHAQPHPTCPSCQPFQPGPAACLSHTCPDCGLITHDETNAAGELTHRCPEPSAERVAFSLHVEDPSLPVEVALVMAERGGVDLPPSALVDSVELLRLAALGYRMEQL